MGLSISQLAVTCLILNTVLAGVKESESEVKCSEHQFQCLHLNLNQILTIHEWNRRPRECIPLTSRCDGRHDCQDGSDEVDCLINMPRKTIFKCYVGHNQDFQVEDCYQRDKKKFDTDTDLLSNPQSVSELKEWVCMKYERPDGYIIRDCMRLYTGGEAFRVCYYNAVNGTTCLCSRDLCNNARIHSKTSNILIFITVLQWFIFSSNGLS